MPSNIGVLQQLKTEQIIKVTDRKHKCSTLAPLASRMMRDRIQFTLLVGLVFLYGSSTAKAQYVADTRFEQELLSVVNDMRSKAGLPALTVDSRLKEAARAHLAEFAMHDGEFSHQYPGEPALRERIAAAKVPCTSGGEVLLMMPDTIVDDAQRAQEALRTSDAQSVILNPRYSSVGFAIAHTDFYIYAVGNFVAALRLVSVQEAESLAAKGLQARLVEKKLPPIEIAFNQQLRDLACEAAEKDSLEKGLEGNLLPSMIVFTADDPEHTDMLSAIMKHEAPIVQNKKPSARRAPDLYIGACFAKSKTYPFGTYWFVVRMPK